MASRYQPLTVIYFVHRLCSNHWLRHRSRMERGERTGHIRHARLHGTWSDVPPKPHDLCWLFRCRCHGLRVHVWTRKYLQLSIDSIRYTRRFAISKNLSSPYHWEYLTLATLYWQEQERDPWPHPIQADSDQAQRHPTRLDYRSSRLCEQGKNISVFNSSSMQPAKREFLQQKIPN